MEELQQINRYNRLSEEDHLGAKSSAYTSDFSASLRRDIRNELIAHFYKSLDATHTLCDIACNNGFNLRDMLTKGVNISGVDLCKDAINHANQIGINAHVASMTDLPFQSQSFDIVTCMEALYHVPDPDQLATLDEAWRILKPGGVLIVVTANLECIIRRLLPSDMFAYPYKLSTFISHLSTKTDVFKGQYSTFPFGRKTTVCENHSSLLGVKKFIYPIAGLAWQKP